MKIDQMADAIAKELSSWTQDVADATKDECKKVADETVSTLKATSPKRTGRYARGWRQKTSFEDRAIYWFQTGRAGDQFPGLPKTWIPP